jgi:diguanylate cyclase (GGDEF)-like protein/PAS domain S-box-containing protein
MGKTQADCCHHAVSQEARFQHIVERTPDVLWSCDKNLNFTYVSPSIASTSGFTAEEKRIQGPLKLLTNRSAASIKDLVTQEVSRVTPTQPGVSPAVKYQLEVLRKDGTTYPAEACVNYIRDDSGQVVEIIGINRDISDSIHAENIIKAYHEGMHRSVGQQFFIDLVQYLCKTLKVRCAMVGRLDGENVHTQGLWIDDALADNTKYHLQGSPCEKVAKGDTLFYTDKISSLYPQHQLFAKLGAKAYMGSPIYGPDASIIGVLVLLHDQALEATPLLRRVLGVCTDRAGAELARLIVEEQLKDSEERLRTLFEHSMDPCIISDLNGRYLDANSAMLKTFAYSAKELGDISICTLVSGDTKVQNAFKGMRNALLDTGSACFQGLFVKQSGECFPGKVNSTLLTVGNKKVVQSILHDLTKVHQAKDELIKLSRAMDASASIVIITDLQGNIEYINPKFSEVTGYSRAEVIGKNTRLLSSGETSDAIYQDLWATIAAGQEWRGELHNRTKANTYYWCRNSISAVKNHLGEISHYISVQEDITNEYQLSEQLNYQACHDALTGLINRPEFERRTKCLLATLLTDDSKHALCFIDLDQFKVVNDTCGHMAGDELLRQLGCALQRSVRKNDTLARLGGDEFAVLIENCPLAHAQRVAYDLQKTIQDFHFSWQGRTFRVSASIGLVAINETTSDLSELMAKADSACYVAKDQGRNRIHIYHPEDRELALRQGEMQWVARIHQAIAEDRLCLHAQAIEPLTNSAGKHYEILIRLRGNEGEIIPPGAFLPAAERYNIITQLDRWVIKECCKLLLAHPAFLEQINFISINLSGQSLTDESFLDFVIRELEQASIDCTKICFEITETAAITHLTRAMTFISTLKGLGCKFALDDFGSGLSSFAYLKNLPVDYLKIDGMFVKGIVNDPIDHAMVKSINEIGQIMGMKTIAEFVENNEIKGMLREIGVNYVQGYGVGKPLPFESLLSPSDDPIARQTH